MAKLVDALDLKKLIIMRKDILERKQDILQWISEKLPNAEIAKQLHCKVDTLKSYYKKLCIEYNGNQSRSGLKHYESRKPIEEILNSICANSVKRKRLIEEGIKENKCECCGLSEWMGRPIPLELHHKDFNHYNNTRKSSNSLFKLSYANS